jgi:hypothetical protein
METGFGSPSIAGEEEWGFGDPEPAAGASAYPGDTGFGSPYIALEPAQVQVLAPLGQYGDDGGYVVEVLGDWPEQGPYRFRFRDAGGNVYPTTSYCYSGVPTQGELCYTLTGGVDIVTFISPPAPPGAYTLLIEWGPGFGNQISVKSRTTYSPTRSTVAIGEHHGMAIFRNKFAVLDGGLLVHRNPHNLQLGGHHGNSR